MDTVTITLTRSEAQALDALASYAAMRLLQKKSPGRDFASAEFGIEATDLMVSTATCACDKLRKVLSENSGTCSTPHQPGMDE